MSKIVETSGGSSDPTTSWEYGMARVVERGYNTIQRRLREFERVADPERLPWYVSDNSILANSMRDAVEKWSPEIRKELGKVWAIVGPSVREAGDSYQVSLTADLWNEAAQPVSGLSAWFSETRLITESRWDDKAADRYKALLPPNASACQNWSARAREMSETLATIATSIQAFWQTIGAAFNSATRKIALLALDWWRLDQIGAHIKGVISALLEVAEKTTIAWIAQKEKKENAAQKLKTTAGNDTGFLARGDKASWPISSEPIPVSKRAWHRPVGG